MKSILIILTCLMSTSAWAGELIQFKGNVEKRKCTLSRDGTYWCLGDFKDEEVIEIKLNDSPNYPSGSWEKPITIGTTALLARVSVVKFNDRELYAVILEMIGAGVHMRTSVGMKSLNDFRLLELRDDNLRIDDGAGNLISPDLFIKH